MSKKAKSRKLVATRKPINVKAKAAAPRKLKGGQADLEILKKPVAKAKTALDKAHAEAQGFMEKARTMIAEAKSAYMTAFVPYREACRKSGTKCEFEGGRSGNVTEAVRFEIEKTDKGIHIRIQGRPKSEEVIPFRAFKESSVSKLAYAYTDRQIGKRSEIGNKGGGLGNRIRAVLKPNVR